MSRALDRLRGQSEKDRRRKRGGQAKASSKARVTRKISTAKKTNQRSNGFKRKRTGLLKIASAKFKNTTGSRFDDTGKAMASQTLNKVKKTVSAKGETAAIVKVRSKQAELNLRTKRSRINRRFLTSAQEAQEAPASPPYPTIFTHLETLARGVQF